MSDVRLIDANVLKKTFENACIYGLPMNELYGAILKIIDSAPTIDTSDTKYLEERDADAFESGYIQGLSERPQGKWVLVGEGLPERYKEVIVTDIEVSNTYQSRYIGNGYWECDNGTLKNRIIAWQELPKPYKESDAE